MAKLIYAILTVFLVSLSGMPLFSDTLDDLVGSERAKKLREAPINEVQLKDFPPVLLPNHDPIKRFVLETHQSLHPSIMIETLFLYQKPHTAKSWSEAERIELFNHALTISTMTGIQYFSSSRNTMRALYETSKVIDSPSSKKAVPDPALAAIPDKLTLYARQKDLTFGDNIYRYEYRSYPDALVSMQENLSTLSLGIIPAVGKNNLRSFMAGLDCGDSILIYTVSMVKTVSITGMGERVGAAFTTRTEAVRQWYIDKIARVLGN